VFLQIDDKVFQPYLAQAGMDVAKASRLIEDCLKRYKEAYQGRAVVVSGQPLERLEAVLNTPTPFILDAEDLCRRVEDSASILMGGIRMDFSPVQMQSLKEWSEKGGLTLEAAVKSTVEEMGHLFFDYLPEAVHNVAREELLNPPEVEAPTVLPTMEEFLIGTEEPAPDPEPVEPEPITSRKRQAPQPEAVPETATLVTGVRGTSVAMPLRPRR
jgi:hypothetical protein